MSLDRELKTISDIETYINEASFDQLESMSDSVLLMLSHNPEIHRETYIKMIEIMKS